MEIPIFLLRLPFFFHFDALVGLLFGLWSLSDIFTWPPQENSNLHTLYTLLPMDFLTAWTWPLQIEPVLMVWAQIKPYLLAFCTKSVVETVPSFCTLFTSLFCLSHLVNPRDKLETALGYLFGIVQQLTIAVAMKSFLVYRAWLFSQYSEPDAELLTRPLFVIQFAPILIGLLTTQEFGPISLWLALDAAAMILYVPQTWITVMHSVVLMWPIANIIFNLFFYYADALEQAVEEIRFFWNHRGHFWIIDAANMFHWQPSIASYWMVRTTWILCRHAPSWLVSIPQIMSLEYSTIIEYWQNLSIETMPAFLQDFLLLSTETIVCVYGFAVSLGYMYDILEDICIRLLKTENRQDTIFLSSGGIVAVYFSTMAFELNMIPHSMPERVQLTLQLLSISVLVFLWPLFQLIRTRLETLQVERQYSFSNQFVPILLSSMILVVCASQTWHIYQEGMKDCWSMAVMVYSIQTFVSVFCMMMQNLLYNIDYVRNVHWDRFDDYLFFTQTIPSYCQIICSVFMVGATGYFSRDRVEAVLKVVLTGFHLYFYVYRATLEEWKRYRDRREAAKLLSGIRRADRRELTHLEDVCSICRDPMRSARVTRCRHYFHQSCLQKWMQLRNTCPMCNQILYQERPRRIPFTSLMRELFHGNLQVNFD